MYEKLKDFCYNCGRLGHDLKICHFLKAKDPKYPFKVKYGLELGVPP